MIDTKLILNVLLHLLPVLFGFTFFNYLLVFVSEDKTVRRLARPLLAVSVVTNFIYLLGFTIYFEHIPMVNVFQVVGAVGFAVAATYLWVETKAGTLHTGPFILFLVLACQVINTLFPKLDREVPEILQDGLFSLHVSAAVLGYSAFVVSAVYGFLYLLLYQDIRRKRFGLVFRRLPSLDILDRMNAAASLVGFMFLTVAIAVGAAWSSRIYGEVHLDPKVVAAGVTWLVYGLAIAARRWTSWSGPRMAYSSLIGFVVILFSIFGVNFFFTRFHEFSG